MTGSIAIIGFREDDDRLREAAVERVHEATTVVVPSSDGPAARLAVAADVTPVTFAELGLGPTPAPRRVAEALSKLSAEGDVVLLTSGYPFASGVVGEMLEGTRHIIAIPGMSPLAALLLAVVRDLNGDIEIVEAHDIADWTPKQGSHLFVVGLANQLLAHAVAERLAETLTPRHRAIVADARGATGFDLTSTPVTELASLPAISGDRAVYVPPLSAPAGSGFHELVRIISILRDPDGGCPWDLEQTHMSIRGNLIEEAYEAVAAIEEHDDEHLSEELGDILLQVVFHAQIGAEDGSFSIDDAIAQIVAKLIRRHPHIFGEAEAGNAAEVLHQWEAIKRTEQPSGTSVLASVPHALPSLLRAQKISRKAAATGFDWETVEDVWEKVHEEIDELKATQPGTQEAADEVGDVLFSVVNVARKLGVDAESALRLTCDRFSKRFRHMEETAAREGRNLADMDTESMEVLWQQAKRAERGESPLGDGGSS